LRYRIAGAIVAAAIVAVSGPLAANAATKHHHPKPHAWHTCVPQATLHVGIYQFDNDLCRCCPDFPSPVSAPSSPVTSG
jgi:hypothetical protein